MKFIKKTPRCAVLMVVLASYVHSEFNNDHFTVYQGFEISAGTSRLFSREVASKLSCARLCAQETSCCTISFNTGSMMCVLVEDCSPLLQITNMGLAMTKIEVPCIPSSIQPTDCNDLPPSCPRGVYHVFPPSSTLGIDVFCEVGGWTVVQKRQDGTVDFFRDWASYKLGFGDVAGEYWMGNEYLHLYTNNRQYTLRIEVEDFHGEQRWAQYTTFVVDSETTNYRLSITGYSGTTGDLMDYSNSQEFTTTDRDHDTWNSGACTDLRGGCFWYGYCTYANLNGRYYDIANLGLAVDTIFIWPWKSGTGDPMKTTAMMIK